MLFPTLVLSQSCLEASIICYAEDLQPFTALFSNSDNVIIEIKLHNLKERHLFVDSSNRVPFAFPREARIDEPWSNPNQNVSVNELLGEKKVEELALSSFLDLVYLFQWDNPPVENLKGDIQKFLEGRI